MCGLPGNTLDEGLRNFQFCFGSDSEYSDKRPNWQGLLYYRIRECEQRTGPQWGLKAMSLLFDSTFANYYILAV